MAIDIGRRQGHRLKTNIPAVFGYGADEAEETRGMLDRSFLFLTNDPPYETAVRNEGCDIVARGIEQLPEMYRNIISLCYFEGLKYREIAERLEIPTGTVKSRLHQSKKLLIGILTIEHPLLAEDYESV